MQPVTLEMIADFPGAYLVREGLKDLHEKKHTIYSCLVRIASPRLLSSGILPKYFRNESEAELELYELLKHHGNAAHSKYNALLRELVSFEHALDHFNTKQNNR